MTEGTGRREDGRPDMTERTGLRAGGGPGEPRRAAWSRRRVLALGLAPAAVLAGAGIAGVELVSRGILPGRSMLSSLDGACSVPSPALAYSPLGPS